ncbi:MAG: hypothetical protein MUC47_03735 [Candidatus Kapabacteria bacterium]|nr:hypothetical protein [Candidatus Kapabacteria bacterium]
MNCRYTRDASDVGQALATAGGFVLTSEAVTVENVAALAFNIPLFETSTLEISKFADRQFAEIGDLVTYQIQLRNAAASPLTGVQIQDQLPDGFVYADGTAGIDGRLRREPITPVVAGRSLRFDLGTMSAGDAVTISYRVRIGASAAEGEQFNLATASGRQPNGDPASTAQARAGIRVRGGVFGLTQVIVGRVFVDADKNGRFDNGEKPLAGVRIYLNNGKSVITDDNGQYSFPVVDSGSMVVALDPVTLPALTVRCRK